MTSDKIIRDLEGLARESALLHAYFEEERRKGRPPEEKLIRFLERTYIHNQRRCWEQQTGQS